MNCAPISCALIRIFIEQNQRQNPGSGKSEGPYDAGHRRPRYGRRKRQRASPRQRQFGRETKGRSCRRYFDRHKKSIGMSAPAAFLETDRMYFREFRDADAQLLFELDSDPEVMRFISRGEPTPLARIQNEFIPKYLDAYRRQPPQGFWAAHLRESGSFIGWFHLRPDKISAQEMELGYRLQRLVWGADWPPKVPGRCLINFQRMGLRESVRANPGEQHGLAPRHGKGRPLF